MWITLVFVVLCSYAHRDFGVREKPALLGTVHSLFTLAAICNSIVCFIYWPFLHESALEQMNGHRGRVLHMYHGHALPTMSLLLMWYLTELRICKSHWKMILYITVFYAPINFYTTMSRGYALYWFLDWKDYKTPTIIFVIATLAIGYFHLLAVGTYMAKPLSAERKSKPN